MDLSFLNTIGNKIAEICNFLFSTYLGIGILIGSCLLITFIVAFILEIRTQKKLKDKPEKEDDEDEEDSD